jgi:hypothetical protein
MIKLDVFSAHHVRTCVRVLSKAPLLALLATALSGTGCLGESATTESECMSFCETDNNCPGATVVDCATLCPELDTTAATSCASEYEAFLSCEGGVSDSCDAPCATQEFALLTCVLAPNSTPDDGTGVACGAGAYAGFCW